MKALIVSLVGQTNQQTMNPIELFWTAKNGSTSVQEGEPWATETRQSRKIILHFFTIFVLLFTKYFSQFPQILPGNPHQKSKNLKQRARCGPYHIPTGTTALRVRKIALRSKEGGELPTGKVVNGRRDENYLYKSVFLKLKESIWHFTNNAKYLWKLSSFKKTALCLFWHPFSLQITIVRL